jgi:hypothetical protein
MDRFGEEMLVFAEVKSSISELMRFFAIYALFCG